MDDGGGDGVILMMVVAAVGAMVTVFVMRAMLIGCWRC